MVLAFGVGVPLNGGVAPMRQVGGVCGVVVPVSSEDVVLVGPGMRRAAPSRSSRTTPRRAHRLAMSVGSEREEHNFSSHRHHHDHQHYDQNSPSAAHAEAGCGGGCACGGSSILELEQEQNLIEKNGQDQRSPSMSRRQALGAALTGGLAAWQLAPQPASALWGYQKENGPQKWGYLDEGKFKICLDAAHQSPIDLRTDIPGVAGFVKKGDVTAKIQTPRLKFAANPVFQGKRSRPGGPLSFPQVATDKEPAIRMLLPNGFVYKFLQFHFHTTSSEHALRGEKGIAEVHFVFGLDKDASAERPVWAGENAPSNAVVGVLYRESDNPCQWTEAVLKSLPSVSAPEAGGQPIKAGSLKDFIPTFENAAYFNYMGSLTTPPCSEGILWFVFSRTATMTMDQMQRLQAVQGGANWRPLQLGGKERGSRYYMPVTEL